MRLIRNILLSVLVVIPITVIAGTPFIQSDLDLVSKFENSSDVYAYYDLRQRSTYLQITLSDPEDEDTICIHVQIYQQDKGCTELNFEDELTDNDTVVYDLDNLVRNDGTAVPITLDDDSYGIVTVAAYECGDTSSDPGELIGNFRIVDDAGYEYRMNVLSRTDFQDILDDTEQGMTPAEPDANLVIPFNTADGATYADVIGFVIDEDRSAGGIETSDTLDLNYNEKVGATFSIFQIDENEERLSCDQKTFGCGPDVVLNYGINEDYRPSRGNNLLCEGASLTDGQTNGYISLENPSFLSPLDQTDPPADDNFLFICIYGLNNGDGTGSMDTCNLVDIDD